MSESFRFRHKSPNDCALFWKECPQKGRLAMSESFSFCFKSLHQMSPKADHELALFEKMYLQNGRLAISESLRFCCQKSVMMQQESNFGSNRYGWKNGKLLRQKAEIFLPKKFQKSVMMQREPDFGSNRYGMENWHNIVVFLCWDQFVKEVAKNQSWCSENRTLDQIDTGRKRGILLRQKAEIILPKKFQKSVMMQREPDFGSNRYGVENWHNIVVFLCNCPTCVSSMEKCAIFELNSMRCFFQWGADATDGRCLRFFLRNSENFENCFSLTAVFENNFFVKFDRSILFKNDAWENFTTTLRR